MISFGNVGGFLETLDKWERDLQDIAEGVTKGLVIRTFKYIVENSAQFSGDFAANWNLSVGKPDYTFVQNKFNVLASGTLEPRIAGHPEAVSDAKNRARTVLGSIQLGQPVFITNTAGRDEPYAWKIEDGVINFREGNQGHTVKRAMEKANATPVITYNRAMELRGEKL